MVSARAVLVVGLLAVSSLCGGCETDIIDILPELQAPGEIDPGIAAVDCDKLHGGDLDVNAADSKLVGLCGIDGNLTIGNTAAPDKLDLLKNIALVKGDLTIAYKLDLKYLKNLQRVDGALTVSGQSPGLSGLGKLASVGGDLKISGKNLDCSGLSKLARVQGNFNLGWVKKPAFAALTKVDGHVHITHGGDSLKGLEKLRTIGKGLTIGPTYIPSLDGLDGLRTIGAGLTIQADGIPNLDALSGLTTIGGDKYSITLKTCRSLTNVDGLAGVKEVKDLRLSLLTKLTSLKGLAGIKKVNYLNVGDIGVPNLDELTGLTEAYSVNITGGKTWQRIGLPNLKKTGAISIQNIAGSGVEVRFDKVTTSNMSVLIQLSSGISSISLAALASCDQFQVWKNANLKTISVPKMKSAGTFKVCENGLSVAETDALYKQVGKPPPGKKACN